MTNQDTLFHFLRRETLFTITPCRYTLVFFFALLQLLRFVLGLTIPFWVDIILIAWMMATVVYQRRVSQCTGFRCLTFIHLTYFSIELTLVTGAVHFAGLTHWFGGIFYLFTIIYAGFLMGSRMSYFIGILASLLYSALVLLETLGFLHHYPALGLSVEVINNPLNWSILLILTAGSTFWVIEYTVTRFAAHLRQEKEHSYSLTNQHESLKTSRRQLQEELSATRRRAVSDGLTGLYNHSYFIKRLGVEVSLAKLNGTPVSLIFIDLDHFKKYNDTYGHPAGDLAISALAKFIKDNSRDGDVVARYGGEEFTMLLPRTRPEDAYVITERLRMAFQKEAILNRSITFSAGIAAFPNHANSAESLLQLADYALYNAKEKGRDRVILFNPLPQT